MYNFFSFCGIFGLLFFVWLLSEDKRRVNWRLILCGLILQSILAAFIFLFPAGTHVFFIFNSLIVRLLESSTHGARFLFGSLAIPPGAVTEGGEQSLGFFLAFQAFPTIIFFSALISILYFFNIMQRVIKIFARTFSVLLRVSSAEALVVASNIFVGVEASLTVKPFLKNMTRSELCTLLTAGMATVASNVLALYVFTLQDLFPAIAGHLLSASLLSAPAAIITSKLIVPETARAETYGVHLEPEIHKDQSLFEAIINGSMSGLKMIAGISALLISVLGLVALCELILAGVGSYLNQYTSLSLTWSLKNILGFLFLPFATLLGIPPHDYNVVSELIGERLVVTEVVAYQDLARAIKDGVITSKRTMVITTYALCGFSHLASMAIFVGGLSAIIPERIKDISSVALRSLIAATVACFITACIAGVFFTERSVLFG
jgi:CNT family concentrative nucleoside transporter